ncbi:MAG: type VI secretion system contractile sheath large subunit [Sphingomonas fennica]
MADDATIDRPADPAGLPPDGDGPAHAGAVPAGDDPAATAPVVDGAGDGAMPPAIDLDLLTEAVPEPAARWEGDRAALLARAHRAVAAIDVLLGAQLDAVLHHPAFQRMEALWRGTAWLAQSMAGDTGLRLRLLDVRWGEMARDLERAMDFDQSVLFEKIYSDEFGTPGGEPYGMIVVDHAIWHRSTTRDRIDDVEVLGGLAEVAAAAFCPIVVGADPRMLGIDDFGDIDLRQDIAGSFTGTEFARYERLRGRPDTRFLAAAMPRLLMRRPYRGRAMPRLGFVYDERVEDAADLCWLTGGFALAQVAARAMRMHRWPAAIRGALAEDDGGIVAAPERLLLPSDLAGVVARFPTENAVSEEQEVALNAAGFVCLRQLHLTGSVAFLNLPTLHRPPDYETEAARMNAKMGAMLNYILCVARFAHYVKVMARDWVGKYTDETECERLLQRWLDRFVTANEDASPEMRVRYPLREARVSIGAIPGRPGSYSCEIAIRPHYQLDQIASEFRLTTTVGREGERAAA